MIKPLLRGSLAIAFAVSLAACGQPGFVAAPGLKTASKLGAKAAFEPETVLENFDEDIDYSFHFYGPEGNHPFYQRVNFSRQKAGGSAALELVAPNCPKAAKGLFLRELDEEEGTFEYRAGGTDDEPVMKLASRVKVGFRWANNTTATSETSLSAQAVFLFRSKSGELAALAYGWSNNLNPGRVVASSLRLDEDVVVPLRTLVIERGNGLGEQCSEAALAKMAPAKVERDFVADVRYAFDKNTPLTDPSANLLDAKDATKPFVPPAGGPNVDLEALVAIGFGAEVPKGVCSHAVLDDVSYAIKKTD